MHGVHERMKGCMDECMHERMGCMRDSRDVDAREGGEGTNEDARDVHGGGARVGGGGGRGT